MTCRYSHTDWLDVLYNSVRRTPGGVVDAARFLTERRGRAIHPESLRAKLRGHDDAISVEMALLLAEWMKEKAGGAEYANDWLLTINAQEGIQADSVPEAPAGGWSCEIAALKDKCLLLATKFGRITGATADASADGRITEDEAGSLLALIRGARVILHRMERAVLRAVEKGKGGGR